MTPTYSNVRKTSFQTVRQATRANKRTKQIPTSTTKSPQQKVKRIWTTNPQRKNAKQNYMNSMFHTLLPLQHRAAQFKNVLNSN
jgi:hypothetical protein